MAKHCEACDTTADITGHHILPSSLGGTRADGVALLCRPCHDLVHCDKLADMLGRERYATRLSSVRAMVVVMKYRQFIRDARRWYRQGVLFERLGIDRKAPRNARKKDRYLSSEDVWYNTKRLPVTREMRR